MDSKEADADAANTSTNPPEELTMDALDEQLQLCRRFNTRLDQAYLASADNSPPKSTRLLIFIKFLLKNGKLMRFYSTLTSNLAACASKFAAELRQIEDYEEDEANTKLEKDNSSSLIECEKIVKMVKTNVELTRLIVELTSPPEMLAVNRSAIYIVLTYFEVVLMKRSGSRLLSELDTDSDSDEDRRFLNHKDYSVYLLKFKDLFVKLDLFSTLSDNILASIRLLDALSNLETIKMNSRRRALIEPRLKHLLVHSLDSILINLGLARNLLVEKNESVLNLVIWRLLESRFDQVMHDLSGVGKLLKPDGTVNLLYSFLAQLNSLMFSTFAKPSCSAQSSKSSSLKQTLTKYGINMCKSGSFANIVNFSIQHLTANKRVSHEHFTDISYFLWLVKFFVANFVLKRLEPSCPTSTTISTVQLIVDNSGETSGKKFEKTFFNDTSLSAAVATKRALLSYDLLAFLSFSMLSNFERLLFESNSQNMTVLKVLTDEKSPIQRRKLVNARSLNLFYLSLGCVYEIIECVNLHLEYLNSSQYQKEKKEEFIHYLNEFINFDELKQSFAMFMRFYAYNPHVYSDSLIKMLIISNQHFLNTYKNVHDLVRHVQFREQESYDLVSDTNATKNSSTVSGCSIEPPITNVKKIYDLYSNTDTSFILKKVLATFESNDPLLNRSCVDFLDGLMVESSRHEKLFHMNFALSLANITLLESFRFLDQRIKDLISAILIEIRCMCKRKPKLANKILFDVRKSSAPNLKRKLIDEISPESHTKRTRMECTTTDSEQSNLLVPKSSRYMRDTSTLESSSCSSLNSTTSDSASPDTARVSFTRGLNAQPDYDLKILVEGEFIFCLRSLDAFNKTKCFTKRIDSKKICNLIVKNDHLYRILKYLIQLFESVQPTKSTPNAQVTSWTIYSCLLNMKFDVNDKIRYINHMNRSKEPNKSGGLKSTVSLGLDSGRNEFFLSGQCLNLRVACSTDEFRKQLKEAYIKYLVEQLCIKSKQTRNAIFWLFNILKKVKLFHIKKSLYSPASSHSVFETQLMAEPLPTGRSSSSSTSIFEFKLFYYYNINNLNMPLIPFSYEIQKVFHSVSFSYLLDLLGIVRTDKSFPYIPKEWLNKSRKELNECLNSLEKCLCI